MVNAQIGVCSGKCRFGCKPNDECNKSPFGNSVLPWLFTIIAILVILLSVISYYQTNKVAEGVSMVVALVSPLEFISCVAAIVTTLDIGFQNWTPTEIGLSTMYAGMGCTLLMNIAVITSLWISFWKGQKVLLVETDPLEQAV